MWCWPGCGWTWPWPACMAGDAGQATADFVQGKLAACRYFYAYELPKTSAWLQVVATREPLCRDMADAWF